MVFLTKQPKVVVDVNKWKDQGILDSDDWLFLDEDNKKILVYTHDFFICSYSIEDYKILKNIRDIFLQETSNGF